MEVFSLRRLITLSTALFNDVEFVDIGPRRAQHGIRQAKADKGQIDDGKKQLEHPDPSALLKKWGLSVKIIAQKTRRHIRQMMHDCCYQQIASLQGVV